MSSQNIFYPALSRMAQHANLKNSTSFNRVMYVHYKALFEQHRYGWNFKQAFFAWKQMKHYEKRIADCQLTELLTELNKNHYVHIVLQP